MIGAADAWSSLLEEVRALILSSREAEGLEIGFVESDCEAEFAKVWLDLLGEEPFLTRPRCSEAARQAVDELDLVVMENPEIPGSGAVGHTGCRKVEVETAVEVPSVGFAGRCGLEGKVGAGTVDTVASRFPDLEQAVDFGDSADSWP